MKNLAAGYVRCVALIVVLVFSGCAGRKITGPEQESAARPPRIRSLAVVDSFAAKAVGSAGGYDAWVNTQDIALSCVVTLYQPDQGAYITRQRLKIAPWEDSIEIQGTEPQGDFTWWLSQGKLRVIQGREHFELLPAPLTARGYAEAILSIVAAPAMLLSESYDFARGSGPIRLEGLWYLPIERYAPATGAAQQAHWSQVRFWQNRGSGLVDVIWFADEQAGIYLMTRGYQYRRIAEKGVLVPTKIEIFRTNARAVPMGRLVEINVD